MPTPSGPAAAGPASAGSSSAGGVAGPGGVDGAGQPLRRTAPPPAADRYPLSPAELDVLDEVEADFERYREVADGHHARMRDVVVRALRRRQKRLQVRYAKQQRGAREQRGTSRVEAATLLEEFIDKHPEHAQFTPDAMFRLADLYLDSADEEIERIEALADPDVDPVADYSKPIALWQQILDRFPRYRQLPGTIYLLAHYGKYDDERRSLGLFLSLVCANRYQHTDPPPPPPSRAAIARASRSKALANPYADCTPIEGAEPELIQHAWVRGVGDHHFDVPGELDQAIAAYGKVADLDETELHAEALYKQAWSFYRRDRPLEAIKRFDRSIAYYDATVARGETPTLALRDEALQYIAVSFTDAWAGDTDPDPAVAMARAQAFYGGRTEPEHIRDVWAALGKAFMDLEAYDQAIVAYRASIDRPWHLHPDNPLVHMEIVNAYESKGDKLGADESAGALATRYGPGTEWYAANEKNRTAMQNQRRIGERMLYVAARNLHAAATEAREQYEKAGVDDLAKQANYLALYGKAVNLYEGFLSQYPDSRQSYEVGFAMAEALYFSGRYRDAAERYRWVRDQRGNSGKHFQDAAYSVIQALEAEARQQEAAGLLSDIRVPTTDELRGLPQPIAPQPIPELHLALRSAWDEYQKLVTDPNTAPLMGLNAGMVSMSYYHLDDAVERFQEVVDRFCGTPEAARAKDGLLSIYDARGQHDAFKAANDKFIADECGDAESLKIAQAQNRSIEFRKGAHLLGQKQYLGAAEQFYRYYKTAPKDDEDQPTALYNAAIAYRLADKPKTAVYLLDKFTKSSNPLFRKSPYYLEALRLTALAHQGVFNYDDAVSTYLALYEEAGTAAARGLTPPPPLPGEQAKSFDEVKLDALYNAAVLRELDRDFPAAIDLYRKYEAEEPDRRRSDRALWAIARIHRSSGRLATLISTYERWRDTYGDDPGNEDDFVFSFYDVAQEFGERKKFSQRDAFCQRTIEAWEAKGSPQDTRGAKYAGECALEFAEQAYQKRFVAFRFRSAARTQKQAQLQRQSLDKLTKEIQDTYLELARFGVAEYAMAAKVRYGETQTLYAQKIFEMPTPKYVLDLDRQNAGAGVVAQYEAGLTERLAPLAEDAKREWVEVVETGKQSGVSNRWTKLALELLNREFPDDFPILHDSLVEGTEEP